MGQMRGLAWWGNETANFSFRSSNVMSPRCPLFQNGSGPKLAEQNVKQFDGRSPGLS